MKRILQRRLLAMVSATVTAAIFGMVAAVLIHGVITFKSTEDQLDQQAWRLVAEVDALQAESNMMLAAMNQTSPPPCSETEFSRLRNLIFNAVYVHDAGHLRNGKIACSVAVATEDISGAQFDVLVTMPNKESIYRFHAPYQPNGEGVIGLGMGDSFVVFDPRYLKRLDLITKNRAFATRNAATNHQMIPVRQLPVVDGVRTDTNWQGRVGHFLLVTRCSSFYPSCMTTYANISAVELANKGEYFVSVSLGGLAGGLLGLAGSILFMRSMSMAQQLRRAIRKEELQLVYQPIVDLSSSRIVGAEALARWTGKDGLPVAPDVFVRVAEESGFVGKLTSMVMRRAVRDFTEVLLSIPEFRLSINVTASDLNDQRFLPTIDGIVQMAGVPAKSVAVEITESSTARDNLAIETIQQLRQRGHSVRIDDFGTGYSSLSYLHELSVDAIKIDKSFTQAIGTEAVTETTLPLILAMARKIGLDVIVEGIETEAQADYFMGAGQPVFAQGWYFGRPVAASRFHKLLSEQGGTDALRAPQVRRRKCSPT
jgi:sensor c-di-GMP phosphodiesterase-like protein